MISTLEESENVENKCRRRKGEVKMTEKLFRNYRQNLGRFITPVLGELRALEQKTLGNVSS